MLGATELAKEFRAAIAKTWMEERRMAGVQLSYPKHRWIVGRILLILVALAMSGFLIWLVKDAADRVFGGR